MVEFANFRGWEVKDGRIYFPPKDLAVAGGQRAKDVSQVAIENTLGYARELETIV